MTDPRRRRQGGRRPGAGAPLADPDEGPRETVCVRLAPSTAEALRQFAAARGVGLGRAIDLVVREQSI